MAMFVAADGVGWLLCARIVQGLATGAAVGVGGAYPVCYCLDRRRRRLGSGFLGSIRAVSQLAEPHERAALLSAVYVVTYLAFSLPALLAGVLTTHIGLRDTSFVYGGFVAVVAVAAAALERLNHR